MKPFAQEIGLVPGHAPAPESLSVVVPTFRRPQSLERCLRGLLAQTRAPDEIIVVYRTGDRASHDAAMKLGRELQVEMITCDRPSACGQMDLGVAHASGDVVALTDDDAVPAERWAERLMGLYGEPDVGAVGGRDVIHATDVDSRPLGRRVGGVTVGGRAIGNHHQEGSRVQDVEFLKGVNMSVRRPLWHVDQNLLGDGNQPHWEIGTCLRIRRLGWRVCYDPGLLVDHYPDVRPGEPRRGSREAPKLMRDAHNELYELVRWLPWWQAATATARAFSLGSKELPGIGGGIWLATHGTSPRRAIAEVRAVTAGRRRALKARPRRHRWERSETVNE